MNDKELTKLQREDHKNNSIAKQAIAAGRDYVTPEDIDAAALETETATLQHDALELLAGGTGFGVEDETTFAYSAYRANPKAKD